MTMLANSYISYRIMDRGRHSATKYLNAEKTPGAINIKLFKRLAHNMDQLSEVELFKSEIEQKEPIILDSFVLEYAKLKMEKLYDNFFKQNIAIHAKTTKWK